MKLSNPKGTKDFLPEELSKRNYVVDVLKRNFTAYGFQEISTPSIENSETLMGKYGDDGDKLVFRILNSGDKIKKADLESFKKKNFNGFINSISSKGLRYDLTVPLARFVSQHQNEISFPFKRFQIQNVWRADRPQRGRFQEFIQCDVDVIGKKSLIQEIELIGLYDSVFSDLGFKDLTIKINHRSILTSVANYFGFHGKLVKDFITIIDKIDKSGISNSYDELAKINSDISKKIFFDLFESNIVKLETIKSVLQNSEELENGFNEIEQVFQFFSKQNNLTNKLNFDLKLARGLNYYTGLIIEVVAKDSSVGSLGGGGRYDDLVSLFNFKNVSGIGISFGLERICIEMDEKGLFNKDFHAKTDVLVINFGLQYLIQLYPLIKSLRKYGYNVNIFQENNKLNKQLSYANHHDIKYVIIMGENEMKDNSITIKNMRNGVQQNKKLMNLDFKDIFN